MDYLYAKNNYNLVTRKISTLNFQEMFCLKFDSVDQSQVCISHYATHHH